MSSYTLESVLQTVTTRSAFREWLQHHAANTTECWLPVKKGRTEVAGLVSYLDAVEEALCFGWIDSTCRVLDGVVVQRFSPRKRGSNWTELNKERCRRLLKLGLMTELGRRTLPDLNESFQLFPEVEEAFKANAVAWNHFRAFPPLYQRVRIDKVHNEKNRGRMENFYKRLEKLINASAANKMIGDWNDYGRLLNY